MNEARTYMHSLHILTYSGPSPVSGSSMFTYQKKCQISRALFFGQGPWESVELLIWDSSSCGPLDEAVTDTSVKIQAEKGP